MPKFQISAGGGTYEVDAPDEATALSAMGLGGGAKAEPSMAADIAGGIQGGVIRGAASLPGLPGGILSLMDQGADMLARQTVGRAVNAYKTGGQSWAADAQPSVAPGRFSPQAVLPGPDRTVKAVEGAIGETYRPQTTAGKYAASVGEMAGSGLRAVPALAAGLLSEGAGQATAGTAAEPWARAGGAIVGGTAAAAAVRPATGAQQVARAADGMTAQQVDAMEALMRDAASVGVPLTRAEAAQQVTNGATRLADLQRVVEGSGGLKPFMAQRPGQIEAAGARQFDHIVPARPDPSMIGREAGQAADAVIGQATGIINRSTRPLYQQADPQRVGVPVHQAITGDPLYAATLQEVRNNPALNRTVAHLPDDSVGVMHMVARRMGESADNARVPGQANSGNTIAANYADAAAAPMAAAEAVTGGAGGSFAVAQATQAALRQRYLEPLMAGPIGKMAGRDTTTAKAVEALFPPNPVAGGAQEVVDAVGALSQRSPNIARQLVRAHTESVFNEATQAIQSGANQFGGATFAAVLRGNRQQAENLAAAIYAMPGGAQVLPGFDRFLDILQATGQRQRVGSQTAFNTEALAELKRGGSAGTAAALGAGVGVQWPRRVLDAFERWNLGRNVDEVARLLTDPAAAPIFRSLATAEAGTARAHALVSRLVSMSETAGTTSTERSRRPIP